MGTVELPLVVGVDGSDSSLQAVDWAVQEASRHALPSEMTVHMASTIHASTMSS